MAVIVEPDLRGIPGHGLAPAPKTHDSHKNVDGARLLPPVSEMVDRAIITRDHHQTSDIKAQAARSPAAGQLAFVAGSARRVAGEQGQGHPRKRHSCRSKNNLADDSERHGVILRRGRSYTIRARPR